MTSPGRAAPDRAQALSSKGGGLAKRAALTLALALVLLAPQTAAARPADRPTPSGLPVPRWVSLKFDEVNARAGPGDDHRAVWTFRARGLPLQVVAETAEWRKVCDPEGGSAWVHRRTVDGRRTVYLAAARELPLRSRPRTDAAVRARLAPRATAALDKCDKGWCRIRADDVRGWAPQSALWGTADRAQCR